jgi:hypothetical protein
MAFNCYEFSHVIEISWLLTNLLAVVMDDMSSEDKVVQVHGRSMKSAIHGAWHSNLSGQDEKQESPWLRDYQQVELGLIRQAGEKETAAKVNIPFSKIGRIFFRTSEDWWSDDRSRFSTAFNTLRLKLNCSSMGSLPIEVSVVFSLFSVVSLPSNNSTWQIALLAQQP